MTSYKLKPGIDVAYIGGVGKVRAGVLLEANHAPGLLVEVPDMPKNPPLESTEPVHAPKPLTEPAPEPLEEKQAVRSALVSLEEKPVVRPTSRPKASKPSGEK